MRRPRYHGVSKLNSRTGGVRLTEQRGAILQVIETAKRHLDAACILRLARRINAAVARSTVYRTLHLLKHHGPSTNSIYCTWKANVTITSENMRGNTFTWLAFDVEGSRSS